MTDKVTVHRNKFRNLFTEFNIILRHQNSTNTLSRPGNRNCILCIGNTTCFHFRYLIKWLINERIYDHGIEINEDTVLGNTILFSDLQTH